jgi:hypothetical protein
MEVTPQSFCFYEKVVSYTIKWGKNVDSSGNNINFSVVVVYFFIKNAGDTTKCFMWLGGDIKYKQWVKNIESPLKIEMKYILVHKM